jgi:hypothetical protein
MLMGHPKLTCIDPTVWRLSDKTSQRGRDLLLEEITYQQIIEKMVTEARVIKVHRNVSMKYPGYFRASLTIRVSPESCALFHSGRSGYRAQYYHSPTTGEHANNVAVTALAQAISSQLDSTRSMSLSWLNSSLAGSGTKVWIHQGPWLRYRRYSDRVLSVLRWDRELHSENEKRRKLALWASLVPFDEDRIDIKGTYLTLDGKHLGTNPKKGRSSDLHELGFT